MNALRKHSVKYRVKPRGAVEALQVFGRLLGCALLWVLLVGVGQLRAESPPPLDLPISDGTYVIGVDDQVSVSVWRNADLSLTVPVRPDGRISTPLVGDIVAAGKTPMQLATDIQDALSQFIREPHVSVILVGLASHEYLSRVRITGAVRSPNSLPHRKGMTVLDLVLAAGGPNDFAAANRTVLYRVNEEGKAERIKIKLDNLLKKGDVESNILLKPGDIITVPESLF